MPIGWPKPVTIVFSVNSKFSATIEYDLMLLVPASVTYIILVLEE